MSGDSIVIATLTLARDRQEEEVLRRSLTALTAAGLPVVLADGGSSAAFLSFVDALPGTTRLAPDAPGLVGQVGVSLRAARAGGAEYILYTEPDKGWFFRERLAGFLQQARAAAAPVVVAARSAESFATFPEIQRFSETLANRVVAEVTSRAGDYFYGPFLMRADLVDRLAPIAASAGWGWRPFLFTIAHRLHLEVAEVVGDFPCPDDQRRENDHERVHRLHQLAQNVDGVAQALAVDLTPPHSSRDR